MLFQERHHLVRDIALVESIPGRHDARPTSIRLCCALGLHHAGERARRFRKGNRLTCLIKRSVGLQPVALIAGPLVDEIELSLDGARRPRAQDEAVACVLDGSAGDFLEAHRPPPLEHGERRMERSRHDGGVEPLPLDRLAALTGWRRFSSAGSSSRTSTASVAKGSCSFTRGGRGRLLRSSARVGQRRRRPSSGTTASTSSAPVLRVKPILS